MPAEVLSSEAYLGLGEETCFVFPGCPTCLYGEVRNVGHGFEGL